MLSLGSAAPADATSVAVTLITGDVVHWHKDQDGRGSATIEDRGVESVFQTIESDEGY